MGVAIVVVYTCVMCWIIFKVCDVIGGIRTTEEAQEQGLDSKYMTEVEDTQQ